jgi:hypothetical protein
MRRKEIVKKETRSLKKLTAFVIKRKRKEELKKTPAY